MYILGTLKEKFGAMPAIFKYLCRFRITLHLFHSPRSFRELCSAIAISVRMSQKKFGKP